MPYAKAIAAFIVPYVLVLLSPLGVHGDMAFEEALTVVLSALITSAATAMTVYFTKNKV
jgi:hypothetical protein